MSQLTGVILAGGRGRRMGTLGERYLKALLPVANRPVIAHHLDLLDSLGIRRVVIVAAHGLSEALLAACHSHRDAFEIDCVEQAEPLGSAHAVACARGLVQGPLLLLLGDYFFSAREPERVVKRLLTGGGSSIAVCREPDAQLIREACCLEVDPGGRVLGIVEKPTRPKSDLKGCGFYALAPEFMDAVARTPRTALRNEYELTEAISRFVADGQLVHAAEMIEWDSNLTRPEDVLQCNLLWLRKRGLKALVAEDAMVGSDVSLDRTMVGANARITGTLDLDEVVVFPDAELDPALTGESAYRSYPNSSYRRVLITPSGPIACPAQRPIGSES